MLLLGGLTEAEAAEKLIESDVSTQDAFFAIKAAGIYNNEEPPDTEREVQIFEK